jgi:hypothetical protein
MRMRGHIILGRAMHSTGGVCGTATWRRYQRRLSANLQAFVDALRASPAGIELAPDDGDGADAAAAARDAAALLAANAGGSAAARPLPAQPDSSQQHAREQLLRQQQQPPPARLRIEEPQPKQQAPAWAAGINQSVAGLLHALGLSEFQPLFEEARVDMAALQLLGREDLRELGLPLGAIVKLLAALKEGRQQQ